MRTLIMNEVLMKWLNEDVLWLIAVALIDFTARLLLKPVFKMVLITSMFAANLRYKIIFFTLE